MFAETRERNENFGTSLLLSNSPYSPKIVNGSFVAFFDQKDVLDEYFKAFSNFGVFVHNSPSEYFAELYNLAFTCFFLQSSCSFLF